MSGARARSDGVASASRRAFLRGVPSERPPLRPPWSRDDFADRCTGCGACASACPERIIHVDDRGLASLSFAAGGCTSCGACAEACEPRAIDRAMAAVPFPHRMRVTSRCLTDRGIVCESCRDACPERAIRLGSLGRGVRRPVIDAGLCTGCGFCVEPCPADAIEAVPAGSAGAPP